MADMAFRLVPVTALCLTWSLNHAGFFFPARHLRSNAHIFARGLGILRTMYSMRLTTTAELIPPVALFGYCAYRAVTLNRIEEWHRLAGRVCDCEGVSVRECVALAVCCK